MSDTDTDEGSTGKQNKKTVDVIITSYRPDKEFGKLRHRLEEQEYRPDRILVMNTGEQYWNKEERKKWITKHSNRK